MNRLYILPFDHRNFFRQFFETVPGTGNGSKERIVEAKRLIYEAFLRTRESADNSSDLAILLDEEYGEEVLREAARNGVKRIVPIEKSGQKELQFEYGERFAEHLEKFQPDLVKALLRYNPEGDWSTNAHSRETLRELYKFCKEEGYPLLLELLVPPGEKDDPHNFDGWNRARLTSVAIEEICRDGVSPDIWKVEGFSKKNNLEIAISAVKEKTPEARVVILGRGEDMKTVEEWLRVGAAFPEVIGFAVGRTLFAPPLSLFRDGAIKREEAVSLIASGFKDLVGLFEEAKVLTT